MIWAQLKGLLNHKVSRNSIALIITQLSNFIPLLLVPYLTRVLGIEGYGVVAVILSLIQFAFVITDYGFSLSATYEIARNKEDKLNINKKIGSIFLAKVPLIFLASTLMMAFPLISQGYTPYFLSFLVGIIAVIGQAYQPTWFFQGIERMKNITYYMVSIKLLYLLIVVLLVKTKSDLVWVIAGWGVSQIIGALIAISAIYREGYQVKMPDWSDALSELKEGSHFFWSRLSVSTYTTATTFLVGFAGQTQAAHFSVCQIAYKVGQNISMPINQALYPYMAREKNWRLFFRVVFGLGLLIAAFSVVMSAFSSQILTYVFGWEYASSSDILIIFLVANIVVHFGQSFGYPAFAALGQMKWANLSVTYGAIACIVALVFVALVGKMSALSVAMVILITEIIVLLLRVYNFYRIKNKA